MTRIQAIQNEVEKLTPEELSAFRAWLAEYEAELWDQQIERDIRAGKLDALAAEALEEYERGETTEL